MIDLRIGRFVQATNTISSFVQASLLLAPGKGMHVDSRSFADLRDAVVDLLAISEECAFDVIAVWAREAIGELDRFPPEADGTHKLSPEAGGGRLNASIARLKDSIVGQAQTRTALILDTRSKELWQPAKPPFGDDFKNKFQTAQYDLDEACKCLAMSRSTACVFHLMRIMEIGLHAIHTCLGIQVALVGNDRNWGNILNRIKTEIGNRGRAWGEKDLFQELYASLDAVKDAWRNSTMHVSTKNTPEEAEHIFAMVRGFMSKLASRMDESGDPKA